MDALPFSTLFPLARRTPHSLLRPGAGENVITSLREQESCAIVLVRPQTIRSALSGSAAATNGKIEKTLYVINRRSTIQSQFDIHKHSLSLVGGCGLKTTAISIMQKSSLCMFAPEFFPDFFPLYFFRFLLSFGGELCIESLNGARVCFCGTI